MDFELGLFEINKFHIVELEGFRSQIGKEIEEKMDDS